MYNYQFYLSNDDLLAKLENVEKFKTTLQEDKELKLERIAFDLNSSNHSISLLSTCKNSKALQQKVENLLSKFNITIDNATVENLCDEEELAHDTQDHKDNSKLKKRKKSSDKRHNHSHDNHNHNHNHGHSHGHSHDHHHDDGHAHENHWLKAALGLLWGVGLLILTVGSFNIPILATYIITGSTSLFTLYLGHNVYRSAWRAWREKRWDRDTSTLYTISTLTIVGASLASMFVPGLPMMFEAAPLVLGFWHLGEGIEHTLLKKISKKLNVLDCVPVKVLLKGKPDQEISVKKLIPNDLIEVTAGNVIPVDGVLTTKALLYTTKYDGQAELQEFKIGDKVKSGMQLAAHSSSLQMRVSKTYQNSYLSLIAKNISQANDEEAPKAPIEIFAGKILQYFIPGLITVAALSGVVIGSLVSPSLAIESVVTILVSACPCALSLITPMAVKIGMNKASNKGVHFNNGKALQAAADIDTVAFDLNGTLTTGQVEVTAHIDDEKFWSYIALLEAQSDRPLAKIIKSHAEKKSIVINKSLEITEVDKSHHSGIKAKINGELFMIGNIDMLQFNGINDINRPYNNPDNGSIYLVRGHTVIGQIARTDPLREDAKRTVKHLQRQGISVHIITGADQVSAEKYATKLKIPKANIWANTVGAESNEGISKGCGLIKMSTDPSQNPFKNINELLNRRNAVILFNDTLYYADINDQMVTKVTIATNKRDDFNRLKENFTNTYKLAEEKELNLITSITGRTRSKASCVQTLKDRGCKVAMVGDAMNDVTAIANSHVGIGVKSSIGDDITTQEAGIVIQEGLLFPIATAFDIAAKTKANIMQNLSLNLTYNSAVTLVATGLFGFTLSPVFGVLGMVIESTLVLANLLYFKQQNIVATTAKTKAAVNDVPVGITSTILTSLGYHSQPKPKPIIVKKSDAENSYVSKIFASPKERSSFSLHPENGNKPKGQMMIC